MRKVKFFSSIQTKISITYISIVALVLLLLNTYPLTTSRDLIFSAKQAAIESQAMLISTSVGALDSITENAVSQVIDEIDTDGFSTVVITNDEKEVIYTFTSETSYESEEHLAEEIGEALLGNDTFYSRFQDGAFYSSSAMPIMRSSDIVGSVYVSEYDSEQGAIILNLQNNLRTISIAVSIIAVALSIVLSKTLTRRITRVVNAIESVREGEYSYRIDVKGNDELARLSDEFNRLTHRLQNTEEMRRRFVADASHELKTPLASIRLLSDSIVQNTEMDSETIHEFVNDIGDEAERLAHTTEKLLSLTRLDNKISVPRTAVDVKNVAEHAMRILRPIADNSRVTVDCSFADGCYISATADDLYQIIVNIVENAIKYNTLNGKVEFKLDKDEESVIIVVEDTGIGIPEEDLPNIFDRFYRVDKARSREAGGSGLGLSIVKSTVDEYGGAVEAYRREGGGMRFVVTFPLITLETKAEKSSETDILQKGRNSNEF